MNRSIDKLNEYYDYMTDILFRLNHGNRLCNHDEKEKINKIFSDLQKIDSSNEINKLNKYFNKSKIYKKFLISDCEIIIKVKTLVKNTIDNYNELMKFKESVNLCEKLCTDYITKYETTLIKNIENEKMYRILKNHLELIISIRNKHTIFSHDALDDYEMIYRQCSVIKLKYETSINIFLLENN